MTSARKTAEDIKTFTEKLSRSLSQIRQIDDAAPGTSPHETVLTGDGFRLLRYCTDQTHDKKPAVLIVYALVNRPWVLDLEPKRSMIARLLERGMDVFLIEWLDPEPQDKDRSLSAYIALMIDQCVDAVNTARRTSRLNLLGVCQGGTLSLCYAALFPKKVKNLITMVTPVDFQTEDNVLSQWVREVDLDRLVGCYGNVPGALLNTLFVSLQPFRLGSKKYIDLIDLADNPAGLKTFARMEKWIADSPDQAGTAFNEFVGNLYQRNALIKDKFVVDNQIVNLSKIRCPVLNIYALADHLVPASASKALANYVGCDDYSELTFDGGHIGIYVSRQAQQSIPASIARWILARS